MEDKARKLAEKLFGERRAETPSPQQSKEEPAPKKRTRRKSSSNPAPPLSMAPVVRECAYNVILAGMDCAAMEIMAEQRSGFEEINKRYSMMIERIDAALRGGCLARESLEDMKQGLADLAEGLRTQDYSKTLSGARKLMGILAIRFPEDLEKMIR